jgi:hypothetical protein
MTSATRTTLEQFEQSLNRAGIPFAGENGHRDFGCPLSPGQATATLVDGKVTITCADGCAHQDVGDAIYLREEMLGTTQAPSAIGDPADELTKILGLKTVGLAVVRARTVGRGSAASVDLTLSNGHVLEFETKRDMGNASRLAVEVASATGAAPTIKAPMALRAVALVQALAMHEQTLGADDVAVEWGVSYLQATKSLTLDMEDQAARWEAFSELESLHPIELASSGSISVAEASTVLEDLAGFRYVRCGWFRAHVRREDPSLSPQQVAHRMQRVGWNRRGTTGRIKASRPKFLDSLAWSFYIVNPGWERDQ